MRALGRRCSSSSDPRGRARATWPTGWRSPAAERSSRPMPSRSIAASTSGRPSPGGESRREVPYHLIDVADPDETFSAGRWAREARQAIRGDRPPRPASDRVRRERLLCRGASERAPARRGRRTPAGAPAWPRGARRIPAPPAASSKSTTPSPRQGSRPRTFGTSCGRSRSCSRPAPPPRQGRVPADGLAERWRVIQLGLRPSREDLYARIAARVRQMLNAGWDAEVRRLLASGVSPDANGFAAIGYREVAEWVSGRSDREETERKIVAATRALAKRQRTWFAREPGVEWVQPGRGGRDRAREARRRPDGKGSGRP